MIVKAAIRKNGIVYTGHRHHTILQDADTVHGLGFGGLKNGEQGFVTDAGDFLDRKQARQHFLDCGQVPFLLFSEDLY